MADDKRKIFYDAVSQDYDLGTEQEFNEKVKDRNKVHALYEGLKDSYNLGTEDEFYNKLNPQDVEAPQQTQTVQQVVQQPSVGVETPTNEGQEPGVFGQVIQAVGDQYQQAKQMSANAEPMGRNYDTETGEIIDPLDRNVGNENILSAEEEAQMIQNVAETGKLSPTREELNASQPKVMPAKSVTEGTVEERFETPVASLSKEAIFKMRSDEAARKAEEEKPFYTNQDFIEWLGKNPGGTKQQYEDQLKQMPYARRVDVENDNISKLINDTTIGEQLGDIINKTVDRQWNTHIMGGLSPQSLSVEIAKKIKDTPMTVALMSKIYDEAQKLDIPFTEYLQKAKGAIIQAAQQKALGKLQEKMMPRDDIEYVLNGLAESTIARFVRGMMFDPEFNKMKDEANMLYGQGVQQRWEDTVAQNIGNETLRNILTATNPTEVARIGVSFAPEFIPMGAIGKLTSTAAKALVEAKVARLVSLGMEPAAAARVVGLAAEGASVGEKLIPNAIAGGVNLGGYNVISEIAHQYEIGEADAKRVAEEGLKGLLVGGAIGTISKGINMATQARSGATRLAGMVGSFAAEDAVFTGAEEAQKWAEGRTDEINLVEDFVRGALTLGVMKVSSPTALKEGLAKAGRALRGEAEPGSAFNEVEREQFENNQSCKDLVRAVNKATSTTLSELGILSKETGVAAYEGAKGKGVVGKVADNLRDEISEAYRMVMLDPTLDYSLKCKVAIAFKGSLPANVPRPTSYTADDETMTVKTRDDNGFVVKTRRAKNAEEYEQAKHSAFRSVVLGDALREGNQLGLEVIKQMTEGTDLKATDIIRALRLYMSDQASAGDLIIVNEFGQRYMEIVKAMRTNEAGRPSGQIEGEVQEPYDMRSEATSRNEQVQALPYTAEEHIIPEQPEGPEQPTLSPAEKLQQEVKMKVMQHQQRGQQVVKDNGVGAADLQTEYDTAVARVQRAFAEGSQNNETANIVMQMANEGRAQAAYQYLNDKKGELTDGQSKALEQYIDAQTAVGSMEQGINDAIESKVRQHDAQMSNLTNENGQLQEVEVLPMGDGSGGGKAFVRSGSLTNQYATTVQVTYVTEDAGGILAEGTTQISKNRIKPGTATEPVSYDDYMASVRDRITQEVNAEWQMNRAGLNYKQGDKVQVRLGNAEASAIVVGEDANGIVTLADANDPNNRMLWIQMPREQLDGAIQAARQNKVAATLTAEASQQIAEQKRQKVAAQESKRAQEIVGYTTGGLLTTQGGRIDLTHKDTKSKAAADYLVENQGGNVQAVDWVESEKLQLVRKQEQLMEQQRELAQWIGAYGGQGDPDEERHQQALNNINAQLDEIERQYNKLNDIKVQAMTTEQKQALGKERGEVILAEQKKAQEKLKGNTSQNKIKYNKDGMPVDDEGYIRIAVMQPKDADQYLLNNYKSEEDAYEHIKYLFDSIDSEGRVVADNLARHRSKLQAYREGRIDLDADELKQIVESEQRMQQRMNELMQERARVNAIEKRLDKTYAERNAEEWAENPSKGRLDRINRKKTPEAKLAQAREEYRDYPEALVALENGLEPQTIEEYVAGIGPRSLNFEDMYVGESKVIGLQSAIGSNMTRTHGVGRNRVKGDTTPFDYVLTAAGKPEQGKGFNEVVHKLWEGRPVETWSDQDIANALIQVLTNAAKPDDLRFMTVNNRITEAEEAANYQDQEEERQRDEAEYNAQQAQLYENANAQGEPFVDPLMAENYEPFDFALGDNEEVIAHNAGVKEHGGLIANLGAGLLNDATANLVGFIGRKLGKAYRIKFAREIWEELPEKEKTRFGNDWRNLTKIGLGYTNHATGEVTFIGEAILKSPNMAVRWLAGHETTHVIRKMSKENPELWKAYQNAVHKAMGEDAWKSEIERLGGIYTKPNDNIIEEVCANFAGDHIFASKQAVQSFIDDMSAQGVDVTDFESAVVDFLKWINEFAKRLKAAQSIDNDMAGTYAEEAENALEIWKAMFENSAEEKLKEEVAVTDQQWSLCPEENYPTEMKTAVAAFVVERDKDGKIHLQPKMVGNKGVGAPLKTMLQADTGEIRRDKDGNPILNTRGRISVKSSSIDKNGNKGSGSLAWRPGKHLAPYPNGTQFAVEGDTKGVRDRLQDNIIFFEVEYAADPELHKQYQLDAWQYGVNKNGKYEHDQAGLPFIPKGSYYMYRTNANPDIPSMIITGEYRINRPLTDAEAEAWNKEAGGTWLPRLSGKPVTEETLKELGLDEAHIDEYVKNFDYDRVEAAHDESDVAKALPGYQKRALNFDDKNLLAAIKENGQDVEEYKAAYDGVQWALSESPKSENNKLFEYFGGTLKELFELSKVKSNKLVKMIVTPIKNKLIDDLKAKGLELSANYNHTIDNFAISHILNEHSKNKEQLRGQLPITEKDIENINSIIDDYDEVAYFDGRQPVRLIYRKGMPDGTTIFVEEVRKGRKELAAVSMRKYKNSALTIEDLKIPTSHTPEATMDLDAVSEAKITSGGKGTNNSGNDQINQQENAEKVAGGTILETAKGSKVETSVDSGIMWSLATLNDPEADDIKKAVVNSVKGQWAKDELSELIDETEKIYEGVAPLLDIHPAFAEAQGRTLLLDKNGRPTFNVFMNNKDTAAPTIEFSTNCVKKEAMNNLFDVLRGWGVLRKLNNTNLEDILQAMKKHGYDIPCSACFLESRRNQQGMKQGFVDKWNNVADLIKLDKRTILDGVDVELTDKQEKVLRDFIKSEGAGTFPARIARLMLDYPTLRGRLDVADLISPQGNEDIMTKWANTPMIGLFAGMAGSASPKPIRTNHPFDMRMFDSAYDMMRPFLGDAGIKFGGFRDKSFSDGDPINFVDEVQVRENLALTKSGMFGYTKVPFLVDLFGETGEFRNMSLWLNVDDRGENVARDKVKGTDRYKYAGLIKVGDPEHQKGLGMSDQEYDEYKTMYDLQDGDWDFYFAPESFPVTEALAFRNEDRFGGRVGTVVVAPSDECIRKALDDERIDMIIGYHASNKSKEGKEKSGYMYAKDYTGLNETKGSKGMTSAKTNRLPSMNVFAPTYFNSELGGIDFNFDEACQTLGDARQAAKAYLEWCDINGFTPKYADFREHENYYKLLENFRRYDGDGNPMIQGAITTKLPNDWATRLDKYLTEREKKQRQNNDVAKDDALLEEVGNLLGMKKRDITKAISRTKGTQSAHAKEAELLGHNGEQSAHTKKAELLSEGKGTNNSGNDQINQQENASGGVKTPSNEEYKPEIHTEEDGVKWALAGGSYFSGGGLVEDALKGVVDSKFGVEYDRDIAAVYRNNHGSHIINADVRSTFVKDKVREQMKGQKVEYFHASPVCKNFSVANVHGKETEIDVETAKATAEFINEFKPEVVTIENVKGYAKSDAVQLIMDALHKNGYATDGNVYDNADFGGYIHRERIIIRAAKDGNLPMVQTTGKRRGWYEAVKDLVPRLTKAQLAPWQERRLKNAGVDWKHVPEPLIVYGGSVGSNRLQMAWGSEPAPSINTHGNGTRIIMPDGNVYMATPRVFARLLGVPDSYKLPSSLKTAYEVIGNGVPEQLTKGVIMPLVEAHDERGSQAATNETDVYGKAARKAWEERKAKKAREPKQTEIMWMLAIEDNDPWLSNAAEGVKKIKQEKATGEQWLKMLQKNGGLKAEEDKWIGLSNWLMSDVWKNKTVTKSHLMQFIADNAVKIEEVHYGEDGSYRAPMYDMNDDDIKQEVYESAAWSILNDDLIEYDNDDNSYISKKAFNDYYYRLKEKDAEKAENFWNGFHLDYWGEGLEISDIYDAAMFCDLDIAKMPEGSEKPINETRKEYRTEGLTNNREIALTVPTVEGYRGDLPEVHFADEYTDNKTVAWVRFGDADYVNEGYIDAQKEKGRVKTDYWRYMDELRKKYGLHEYDFQFKNISEEDRAELTRRKDAFVEASNKADKTNFATKVLVMDEVQSQRHQDGREKGYDDKRKEFVAYQEEMRQKYNTKNYLAKMTDEENTKYQELSKSLKGVPDAPFRKNWSEIGMKRMLRYAAENGYDKLAWTTGAQQAMRYNLGNAVRDIKAGIEADGNRFVQIHLQKNGWGTTLIQHDDEGNIIKVTGADTDLFTNANNISDVVGKELAVKILAQTEKGREGVRTYKGDDLIIGGSGMKSFYDGMLVKFMDKYCKKWGVKVQDVELDLPNEADRVMHSVEITPEMKEEVLDGQLMWCLAGTIGADNLDKAAKEKMMSEEQPKTADNLANLRMANEMEKRRYPAEDIKYSTGWERGVDGKWRLELPDLELRVEPDGDLHTVVELDEGEVLKLSDIVKNDNGLFDAYPELADVEVEGLTSGSASGSYNPETKVLKLNVGQLTNAMMSMAEAEKRINALENADDMTKAMAKEDFGSVERGLEIWRNRRTNYEGDYETEAEALRDTLAHEVQHYIQHVEGFAEGGNERMDAPESVKAERRDAYELELAELNKQLEDAANKADEAEFAYRDAYRKLNEHMYVKDDKGNYTYSSERANDEEGQRLGAELQRLKTINDAAYDVERGIVKKIQAIEDEINGPLGRAGYYRLAGEVEARAVGERAYMTPEERRQTLARSFEIAPERQIVIQSMKPSAAESARYDELSSRAAENNTVSGPRSDEEEAELRDMVRDAAAKAMPRTQVVDEDGKPKTVYHGTTLGTDEKPFTVFRTDTAWNKDNIGSHFGDRGTAGEFATNKMYEVFLNITKPYETFDFFADIFNNAYLEAAHALVKEIGTKQAKWMYEDRVERIYPDVPKHLFKEAEETSWSEVFDNDEGLESSTTMDKTFMEHREALVELIRSLLELGGYDGLKYQNWYEGDGQEPCWVTMYPEQIKSAEAVTYDDEGKVIPLEDRFDPVENDIRWMLGDIRMHADVTDDANKTAWERAKYEYPDNVIVMKDGAEYVTFRDDARKVGAEIGKEPADGVLRLNYGEYMAAKEKLGDVLDEAQWSGFEDMKGYEDASWADGKILGKNAKAFVKDYPELKRLREKVLEGAATSRSAQDQEVGKQAFDEACEDYRQAIQELLDNEREDFKVLAGARKVLVEQLSEIGDIQSGKKVPGFDVDLDPKAKTSRGVKTPRNKRKKSATEAKGKTQKEWQATSPTDYELWEGNDMGQSDGLGEYYEGDWQALCHAVKRGESGAIKEAARRMATQFLTWPDEEGQKAVPNTAVDQARNGMVIIPVPSHTGKATYMLKVAKELSKLTGVPYADVLRSEAHDSSYELKAEGKEVPETKYYIDNDAVKGTVLENAGGTMRTPILIDNVAASGKTLQECIDTLTPSVRESLNLDDLNIHTLVLAVDRSKEYKLGQQTLKVDGQTASNIRMQGWSLPKHPYYYYDQWLQEQADDDEYAEYDTGDYDSGIYIEQEGMIVFSQPGEIGFAESSDELKELYENPWRDVKKASVHTSNMRRRYPQIWEAAKHGDVKAAYDLVKNVAKPSVVMRLATEYPDAIVAYPHYDNATSRTVDGEIKGANAIPGAYAEMFERFGMVVDTEIVQKNRVSRTDASKYDRLINRARFGGDVIPGQEYILVDDHITSGATLRDMKDYIESRGGKVVAFSALEGSAGSTNVEITDENINKLKELGVTDEHLQNLGIGRSVRSLTNSEAREIIVLAQRGRDFRSKAQKAEHARATKSTEAARRKARADERAAAAEGRRLRERAEAEKRYEDLRRERERFVKLFGESDGVETPTNEGASQRIADIVKAGFSAGVEDGNSLKDDKEGLKDLIEIWKGWFENPETTEHEAFDQNGDFVTDPEGVKAYMNGHIRGLESYLPENERTTQPYRVQPKNEGVAAEKLSSGGRYVDVSGIVPAYESDGVGNANAQEVNAQEVKNDAAEPKFKNEDSGLTEKGRREIERIQKEMAAEVEAEAKRIIEDDENKDIEEKFGRYPGDPVSLRDRGITLTEAQRWAFGNMIRETYRVITRGQRIADMNAERREGIVGDSPGRTATAMGWNRLFGHPGSEMWFPENSDEESETYDMLKPKGPQPESDAAELQRTEPSDAAELQRTEQERGGSATTNGTATNETTANGTDEEPFELTSEETEAQRRRRMRAERARKNVERMLNGEVPLPPEEGENPDAGKAARIEPDGQTSFWDNGPHEGSGMLSDNELMWALGTNANRPRRKRGESEFAYLARVAAWEQQQERLANATPAPDQEEIDRRWMEQYENDHRAWMERHGLSAAVETAAHVEPKRQDFDSVDEYADALRQWEAYRAAVTDAEDPEPSDLDYMVRAQDEFRNAMEAWRRENDIRDEEDATLHFSTIFTGQAPEPRTVVGTNVETGEQVEMPADEVIAGEVAQSEQVLREIGAHTGFDNTPQGAKKAVKRAVIERRKTLEGSGAEDAIFLHGLKKQMKEVEKELDKKSGELDKQMPFVMEAPTRLAEVIGELYYAARQHPLDHYLIRGSLKDIMSDEATDDMLINDIRSVVDSGLEGGVKALEDAVRWWNMYQDPRLQPIIDEVQRWYQEFYTLLDNHGLRRDAGHVTNYVNHVWSKELSDPKAYETYVRTTSPNMRQRQLSTYAKGVELGLAPKYETLTQMMAHYSRQNNEAIANRELLDYLTGLTVDLLNSDGEVVNVLSVLSSEEPNGFIKDMYVRYEVPGIGGVWVLKDVQKRFATIFGQEYNRDANEGENKFWRAYDSVGDLMKKIQLSVSGFHALALTEVASVQKNPMKAMADLVKYTFWDSMRAGTTPPMAHPDDFKDAAAHLVKLGASDDYAAAEVRTLTGKLRKVAQEVYDKQKAVGAAPLAAATLLDWFNKGSDKLLWDYIHDGLKVAAFRGYAKKLRAEAEKKGWSEAQLDKMLDEAGQYVNDAFGGQYWEVIGVTPSTLRTMRRALLSPDWFISTSRHAMSMSGFGSLYAPEGFRDYLTMRKKWQKSDGVKTPTNEEAIHTMYMDGAEEVGNEGRKFRAKGAWLCYGLLVPIFYGGIMNVINAALRKQDEEREKDKADEQRKMNPEYKSPYELVYPDGMKWYDYTMYGNTEGNKTQLFAGRYEDGTERYIRWGKQFREIPEFFMGRYGVEVPGPLLERMMGKSNPVAGTMLDVLRYYGAGLLNKTPEQKRLEEKYGKHIGALAMVVRKFMPFSVPTQEDKEFYWTDLLLPSKKGFSDWRALDAYEHFILAGDMDGVAAVTNACIMNGIDAEQKLEAAIKRVEAMQKKERGSGVEDLQSAMDAFEQSNSAKDRKALKKKIAAFMLKEQYKNFTAQEARERVEERLNGVDEASEGVSEKQSEQYLLMLNADDVRDDIRLSKAKKAADAVVREGKSEAANGDGGAYLRAHEREIRVKAVIGKYSSAINKLKKTLGKGNDEAVMEKIAELRKKALAEVDK